MRCQNCNHDNADENRFCGMCGESLGKASSQPEYVIKTILEPLKLEWEPKASSRQVSPTRAAEPDLRSARTVEAVVAASPLGAPPRRDERTVDEGRTAVGGRALAGLSNSGAPGNGRYSYLFQDEPERSHTALWVLLLILLVLGGVVYLNWRPIRDYVLTMASMHSATRPPAVATTTPGNAASLMSAATGDARTTTTAEIQPHIANPTEGLTAGDERSAAGASEPDQGASPTSRNTPSPATTRPDNSGAKQSRAETRPAAKPGGSENEASQEVASATAAVKPARKARATQRDEGSELVAAGERYLYSRGVGRSCEQAVSYFKAAAVKQNPQAFSHLGALYATGECVPMDRALAYSWFQRARTRDPSNLYLEQNLTMLRRQMSSDERQRALGKQ